jgi:molybdopterin converting factor small subunit
MAVVRLRSPLRDLAGGAPTVRVQGVTVGEALRALEVEHPSLAGWIVDEHGRIRRHVNVYVDGERCDEDEQVGSDDVLHIVSAISGGIR